MRHLLAFVAVASTIGVRAQVLPRPATPEAQIASNGNAAPA